jgi:hypothetical protein
LLTGSVYAVANLGETVTLLPSADVYTTNMLEPGIAVPRPSAIHEYVLGAAICMKMSPAPAEAVREGMLSLKQTLVMGQ